MINMYLVISQGFGRTSMTQPAMLYHVILLIKLILLLLYCRIGAPSSLEERKDYLSTSASSSSDSNDVDTMLSQSIPQKTVTSVLYIKGKIELHLTYSKITKDCQQLLMKLKHRVFRMKTTNMRPSKNDQLQELERSPGLFAMGNQGWLGSSGLHNMVNPQYRNPTWLRCALDRKYFQKFVGM